MISRVQCLVRMMRLIGDRDARLCILFLLLCNVPMYRQVTLAEPPSAPITLLRPTSAEVTSFVNTEHAPSNFRSEMTSSARISKLFAADSVRCCPTELGGSPFTRQRWSSVSPSTRGRVDAIMEEFRSPWPVGDCGPMMWVPEDVVAAPRLKNRRNFELIRDLLTSLSVDRCLPGRFLDDVAGSAVLSATSC